MRRYENLSADQIMHRQKLDNLRALIAGIDAQLASKAPLLSARTSSGMRNKRGELVRELMRLVRERTPGRIYTPAEERAIVEGVEP